MRKIFFVSFLCCAAVECRTRQPESVVVRPVKVETAASAATLDRDFAGMATPAEAVNLAFRVAGQVLRIPVTQGQNVARGQLLAELDPREIRLQVDADRTAYEEASSQLARMKRLLEHEAVSRMEYEAAQTRYAQARSKYGNSKDALAETRLVAPFAAVVEQAYADDYQRVQAGEPVVRLVAPRTTTVKFTMPESGLRVLRDTATRFSVVFDSYRDVRFDAVLKEYSKTSSDASGFPVALTLRGVDTVRYTVSPGMACTITVRSADPVPDAVSVPLTAVYAPAEGGTCVWIVDTDDRVRRVPVTLGEPYGRDRVVIDRGVAAGDRVVTAGVYRLTPGERVRILR